MIPTAGFEIPSPARLGGGGGKGGYGSNAPGAAMPRTIISPAQQLPGRNNIVPYSKPPAPNLPHVPAPNLPPSPIVRPSSPAPFSLDPAVVQSNFSLLVNAASAVASALLSFLSPPLEPDRAPPIAEPISADRFASSNVAVTFGEIALCRDPGWLAANPCYQVGYDLTGFVSTLRDTYFSDPAHPGHYRDNLGNTTFTQTPRNTFYVGLPGFRPIANPPLNDAGTSAIVAAPPPATTPDTLPAPATVPDTAPTPLDNPLREGKPVIVPFRTAPATPQTPTPQPTPEPEPTPAPEPDPEPTPPAPELPPSDPDPIFDPDPDPAPEVPPSEPKPQPEPQPEPERIPIPIPAPIPEPGSIPVPAPIPDPAPIPAPAPIPVPTQPQPNPEPVTPPNPAPAPIPTPAEPAPEPEPPKKSPIFLPPIEIPTDPDLAPISPPARPKSNPQIPAPNPGEPDIQEWTPDNDPAILPGSIPMPGDALPLTIPPSTPAPAPAPAPLPIPSAPGYAPAPFSPLPIPAAPPPAPIAPITPATAAVAPSPVTAGSAPATPTTVVPSIPAAGAKPIYQPNTAPGQIVPAPTPGGDPCRTNSSDLCQGQISDVVKGLRRSSYSDKIEKLDLKAVANTAAIASVAALLAATPIAIKKFIKCNGTEPIFGREPITVPAFLVQAALANFDRLANIEAQICTQQEAIATIPEWYQVRLEGGIPQLVLVSREIRLDGSLGNDYYSIAIPHPKSTTKPTSKLTSDYDKGNWQGVLTLTDNSKTIVNCKSSNEVKRVIDEIKGLIHPDFLTKSSLKIAEFPDKPFKKIKVRNYRADYYSQGLKNLKPDWRKRL